MFYGSLLANSMVVVLLYCLFGDKSNATQWIASYIVLNEASGSFGGICMFCNYAAASAMFGMSE